MGGEAKWPVGQLSRDEMPQHQEWMNNLQLAWPRAVHSGKVRFPLRNFQASLGPKCRSLSGGVVCFDVASRRHVGRMQMCQKSSDVVDAKTTWMSEKVNATDWTSPFSAPWLLATMTTERMAKNLPMAVALVQCFGRPCERFWVWNLWPNLRRRIYAVIQS